MLPMFGQQLVRVNQYDPLARALANRHYNRQTPDSPMFTPPGRKLILRNSKGTVLFAWLDMIRDDSQDGWYCSIFRNESPRLSSEIIREACDIVLRCWGPNRVFTYVDPIQVKSKNPGYCFLRAGWKREGTSLTGKHIFAAALEGK